MYLVVGGLVVLLLASAGATLGVRLHLVAVGHHLTNTLRPAQVQAADLAQAYIDEETGERGYLLTRDEEFLRAYDAGKLATARITAGLRRLFADDPVTTRMIDDLDRMAATWRRQVIGPEIAAFRSGTLGGDGLVASVDRGRMMFDELRTTTENLQNRVDQLVASALQDSSIAQTTANDVTIGAALAAALLALLAAWQLRTSFAVPLNQLVGQVRRVSGGDLDQSVRVSGPEELEDVGRTVEAMRVRILAESARSAGAARQLARYEEAERIASSLGDTVIRQLFRTSLALQSAASRYPSLGPVLRTMIGDLDRAVKDLQSAIFELSSAPTEPALGDQVLELVDQLAPAAAPEVQFSGDLAGEPMRPVAGAAVAVVREVLGAMVRPSTIGLTAEDDEFTLHVTGTPTGSAADRVGEHDAALRTRAERLGGGCVVDRTDDTVTVHWHVPIPPTDEAAR